MSQQNIEYRQLYARLYAQRVKNGKLFTDRAAQSLQEGRHKEALQDLTIARSFFPENEKLVQLVRLVRSKIKPQRQEPAAEGADPAHAPDVYAQPPRPTRHNTQGNG
jgi:hypothetical protein